MSCQSKQLIYFQEKASKIQNNFLFFNIKFELFNNKLTLSFALIFFLLRTCAYNDLLFLSNLKQRINVLQFRPHSLPKTVVWFEL